MKKTKKSKLPKSKPPATAVTPTLERSNTALWDAPLVRAQRSQRPVLRFTPTAWAKLLRFYNNKDRVEVGGFGISSTSDFLLVRDIYFPKQTVSAVTFSLDDAAVAAYFEQQVEAGRHPCECARIWVHTHPRMAPIPSARDEETFQRAFGGADWAVLFVLGEQMKTYARLYFSAGPSGSLRIPVKIDYTQPFQGSDHAAWDEEYRENIIVETPFATGSLWAAWRDSSALKGEWWYG